MKPNLIAIAVASTLLGSSLLLGGCASAPKTNATLTMARDSVSKAEADPSVSKYAPTELDKARKLLINAEGAAKEKGPNDPNASHYAYLATQMARTAEQRAHEQAAVARIKSGETERQQILLSARENEADQAVAQARTAQSQAEAARNEALNAKSQADLARNDAQNAQAQLNASQAESQRLANELADMQAKQTSRGVVLTLGDVLFDTGRSDLKSGAQRSLDQLAQFLTEHSERSVQVEGFTDSQGTDEYNMQLSQRRADAVASAITRRGIAADRVRALGYGEEYPVAGNDNAGSRQMNRRVEIIVSNDDRAIPSRVSANSP
jgi:outer membrane protein OmpA-like peptidoglycan-associated protein